jgi:hypothetical protein
MQMKLLGITNVEFDVIDNDLSNFLYPTDTAEKWEYNGTLHELFIDFKKPMIQLGGKYYTIFSLSLEYPEN